MPVGLWLLLSCLTGCGGPNHLYLSEPAGRTLLAIDRAVIAHDPQGRWEAMATVDPPATPDSAIPLFGSGAIAAVRDTPLRWSIWLTQADDHDTMNLVLIAHPLVGGGEQASKVLRGPVRVRATALAGSAVLLLTSGQLSDARGSPAGTVIGLLRGEINAGELARLRRTLPATGDAGTLPVVAPPP